MYIVKKMIMNIKIPALLFVLIFSLSVNAQKVKVKYFHYTEFKNPITDSNLIPLEKGSDPQIVIWKSSEEFMQKRKDLKKQGYAFIGSYFGHPMFKTSKNKKRVLTAAKKARATLVLAYSFVTAEFYAMQKEIPKEPTVVNTVTPNPTTTAKTVATNNGKSPKLGVSLRDLTLEERTDIERNKGAYIVDVLDDTPAFESNVIPGDILIKISNFQVKNAAQALLLINAVDTNEDLIITVFRKGGLREITIKF